MSEGGGGRRTGIGGRALAVLVLAGLAWIGLGTEWSLVFEKEGFLRGVEVEAPAATEDESCAATLDLAGLPERPTRATLTADGRETPLPLDGGRAPITYPRGAGPVMLRLTYVGALHKPSHADITLSQDGCRLQATGFQSMPLLPF